MDGRQFRAENLKPVRKAGSPTVEGPMRVHIVMPLAEQRGGAEKMLQHLLANSPGDQVAWCVTFLENGPLVDWAADRKIPVSVVNAGRLRSPLAYAGAVSQLVKQVRQWQPDLLFSWMTKAQLYAGVAARVVGVPAVWFNHTITDRGALDRIATLLPARWVAVPSKVAAEAQAALPGSPPCKVIYPGIDLRDFRAELLPPPAAVREELQIPEDRLLVGTVARLQRWKGVHIFLQAVALASQTVPNLHAMVVGGSHFSEPDYPDELRQLATQLGISDRVTFTGHRQDVPRLMNAFDIFVHASSLPEPGGMTNMEAMALGKPVIATRAGGPTEVVADGETGILVLPNNVEVMADGLLRLVSQPELGRRFGRAAIERVQRHFSAEVMAQRVVALARETAGRGGAA